MYAQVLLGLENDLHLIAKDDVLGRKRQAAGLLVGKRAPRKEIEINFIYKFGLQSKKIPIFLDLIED